MELQGDKSFEGSFSVYFEVSTEGIILDIGPEIFSLIGYTREELCGRNFLSFVQHQDIPSVIDSLARIPGSLLPFIEYGIVSKTGNISRVRAVVNKIADDMEAKKISGHITAIGQMPHETNLPFLSDSFYQTIFNASPDAISIADLEGRIIYTTPKSVEMYGYKSILEIAGRKFHDFVDETDHPKIQKEIYKLLNGEFRNATEFVSKKAGGTVFHTEINAELIRNSDGIPVNILLIIRDITERKKVEEELRQQTFLKDLLFKISNTYNDLHYEALDAALKDSLQELGEFIKAERMYIFSYNFEAMTASNTHEWCAPGIEPQIDALQNNPIDAIPEWTSEHIKGKPVIIANVDLLDDDRYIKSILQPQGIKSILTVPMMNAQECIGFVGIDIVNRYHDFSDNEINLLKVFTQMIVNVMNRSLTEKSIKDSEQKFRQIAENISDIVWTADLNMKISYLSPSFSKILGYNPEELSELSLDQIYTSSSLKKYYQIFAEIADKANSGLPEQDDSWEFETEVFTKKGKLLHLLSKVKFIWDEKGNRIGVIGVTSDITSRHEAELKLKESNDRAMTIMNSIDSSIYIADMQTHEILFLNETAKQSRGEQLIGRKCFEALQGNTQECSFCTNRYLVNNRSESAGIYKWEFQNKLDGRWYDIRDVAIPWTDGRMVRLEIATDITERKQNEKDILKFRTIAEKANYGSSISLVDGTLIFINQAYTDMLGYKDPSELIGQNLSVAHNEEQLPHVMKLLDRLNNEGSFAMEEVWLKRADGSVFPGLMNGTLIRNENNEPQYYSSTAIDISELKKSELALKESERQLNFAQEQAGMGSWELDFEHNRVKWSKNLFQMMEMEPVENDLPNEVFMSHVYPEDLPVISQKLEEMVSTGNSVVMELRMVTEKGNIIWLENNITPVFDEKNLTGLKGSALNITEKKKIEREISLQNIKLNAIISSLPDMVFVIDRNGITVEYFSSDTEQLLVPEVSIIGTSLTEVFGEEEAEYHLSKIRECLDLKRLTTYEYSVVSGGGKKDYESRIVPLEEDTILALVRDITISKRAEEEILELNASLEEKIQNRTAQLAEVNNQLKKEIEDRKLIEIELDRKVQELESFFWVSLDMLCIADLEGNFLKLNKAWEESLGYTVDELLKISYISLLHPDDLAATSDALVDLSEQKPKMNFINRYRAKNGEYRYLEWRTAPLGNILYGAATDITLKKQSDTLLEQTRFNYETFFNAIDDFLWVLDWQGDIIHANQTVFKRLGYSREEIIHQNILFVHPSDRHHETKSVFKEMLAGKAELCIVPLLTKFNELIPVETRINHGEWNGQPVLFGVSKDISQIQLSEQKFSAAFLSNSAIMAISLFNEGRFIDVNHAFIEAFGYNREDVLNKYTDELIYVGDSLKKKDIIQKLKNNQFVRDYEIVLRNRKGITRTGLLSAEVIYIGDKKCLLTVIVDISDRKRAEAETVNARLEAEQANLAKSEFLSRMSHELRTPMNSILGFAQLLEMGDLNAAQRKGVTHILKSGRHLLDLINEVLDITRIEAGKVTLYPEAIPVKSIISEMLDIVHPLAYQKKIRIKYEQEDKSFLVVNSDRQRLKQVLLNLISNAIKYNREAGLVTIKAEFCKPDDSAEEKIRISVYDTGFGISGTDIPRLFKPFERIGAENTPVEGSGLGLTVVKKMMDLLGGRVGVESAVNEGTTFWIELPSHENPAEQAEIAIQDRPVVMDTMLKSGKILYIEDNVSNIELVDQILKNSRPGIQLITNMYGNQTLKLALEYKPDLILLDLNLPDIHGSDVLVMLSSEPLTSSIPVVVITADAMKDQMKMLMDASASSYMTKPIEVKSFLRLIDEYFV